MTYHHQRMMTSRGQRNQVVMVAGVEVSVAIQTRDTAWDVVIVEIAVDLKTLIN